MTYEFECPNGHVTELVCSLAERPVDVDCPCGLKARPIVSRFGIVLGARASVDDDDARQARAEHASMVAWGEAAGTLSTVYNPKAPKSAGAQVTAGMVAERRRHLASGGKVPRKFKAIAPQGHYAVDP